MGIEADAWESSAPLIFPKATGIMGAPQLALHESASLLMSIETGTGVRAIVDNTVRTGLQAWSRFLVQQVSRLAEGAEAGAKRVVRHLQWHPQVALVLEKKDTHDWLADADYRPLCGRGWMEREGDCACRQSDPAEHRKHRRLHTYPCRVGHPASLVHFANSARDALNTCTYARFPGALPSRWRPRDRLRRVLSSHNRAILARVGAQLFAYTARAWPLPSVQHVHSRARKSQHALLALRRASLHASVHACVHVCRGAHLLMLSHLRTGGELLDQCMRTHAAKDGYAAVVAKSQPNDAYYEKTDGRQASLMYFSTHPNAKAAYNADGFLEAMSPYEADLYDAPPRTRSKHSEGAFAEAHLSRSRGTILRPRLQRTMPQELLPVLDCRFQRVSSRSESCFSARIMPKISPEGVHPCRTTQDSCTDCFALLWRTGLRSASISVPPPPQRSGCVHA